jgi:phosphatidylserine decarboxylase
VVGSILTSVEEGQHVNRADELGYFAFGKLTVSDDWVKLMNRWINNRLAIRERSFGMG